MSNREGFGARLRAWLLMCALLCVTAAAWANEPRIVASGLQRSAQGLQLNVRLDLRATPAVEQALIKGVPVYFVWHAEMIRDRWYWYDKKESVVHRTLRLAYQPLTRRWRLSVSTESEADNGGLGLTYALHQSFDTLDAALAVVGRVAGWQVADASQLSDGDLRVEWQFDLDLALLPRPFQLGMASDPDWRISVQQRLDVPPPASPELDQAPEPPHLMPSPEGVK
ncbi:MAG: DUF4390 domain-containing protein [Burkholderiaceae bacterium]